MKDWISSAKVFGMPLSIRKHKPRERRRKVLIRAETSMFYIEPCEDKLVLWVWATSAKGQFLIVPVLAEK
jgi:hypothetical protein